MIGKDIDVIEELNIISEDQKKIIWQLLGFSTLVINIQGIVRR